MNSDLWTITKDLTFMALESQRERRKNGGPEKKIRRYNG